MINGLLLSLFPPCTRRQSMPASIEAACGNTGSSFSKWKAATAESEEAGIKVARSTFTNTRLTRLDRDRDDEDVGVVVPRPSFNPPAPPDMQTSDPNDSPVAARVAEAMNESPLLKRSTRCPGTRHQKGNQLKKNRERAIKRQVRRAGTKHRRLLRIACSKSIHKSKLN